MSDSAVPVAFEHNGQPIARERFYQIACDPRRSVAVEACAGAGKTWMLVSRMLRALLEGSSPQEILAITFTKKAAGEMRQRLQEWLHSFASASDATLQAELRARGVVHAASPAQLQTLRGLHASLLQGGRPVQIRTFHSWFAALLRTAPWGVMQQLGLANPYQLLEDDKKATAQVWRIFQHRVADDGALRADYHAAVAEYGRFNTQKALESALAKRTEFALADAHGVVDTSVARFEQQFADFAGCATPQAALLTAANQALLHEAARVLGQQKSSTCQKAGQALEMALTAQHMAGIFAALLTKTGEARKLGAQYAGADTVRAAQDLLLRINQAELQHAAWLHQQRMARLSRVLIAEYAELKRMRGWIDMGDLETAALTLLSDDVLSGWVQERLDARIRHLLIDEFQDTNPLQWQALYAWLSSYAGAGHAPAVFIVGDPKQSIYRFRRAEPQVFRAAQQFVKTGLGGDVLSCDHTRRNAPAIMAAVNAVMTQAQAQQEFDGYRRHSTESTAPGLVLQLPAVALLAAQDQGMRQQWRNSLTEPRYEEEESRKVLECRQAALWLQSRLRAAQGALQPSDIMVLARKREPLSLMQAELAKLHIAAQQPEKSNLMDFAEVQDLIALLDVLVSSRHNLALARALKSPLFAVQDADLVQLALRVPAPQGSAVQANAASWLQVLLQGSAWPSALAAAASSLARWQDWVRQLSPHDALSAIYQDGDVLARFAAALPSTLRQSVLANLNALPHAALALDGGRYSSCYGFVRAMRAEGSPAPGRADSAAVRLLTVHGAKGLEAPLVLLLDTDAREPLAQTMGVLVDWPGENAWPRRLVFLASETHPPACVADALASEQTARSREELNALYVALTRTQHTLVLSSTQPRNANPGSWWARLQPHASPTEVPAEPATVADEASAHAPPEGSQVASAAADFALAVLPQLAPALRLGALAAHRSAQTQALGGGGAGQDGDDSRIGQAMHWLLEMLPVQYGGYAPPVGLPKGKAGALWSAEQLEKMARTYVLDAPQQSLAAQWAQAIATGQAAWAWDAQQLSWQHNEVPLSRAGRLLRADRLVQLRSTQEWWVLDYKSKSAPQHDADLCAQLQAYRDAIAQAKPGQTIRMAFLTPQGALIEIHTP